MNLIKDSIVEQFTGSMSSLDILLSLTFAFLIAAYIIFIYRKTFTGVIYSKSFSMSLLLLAMVTSLVIRTISSNLALSLGMVGALSIVRFRTAVKEPVDTAFMFWAISAGIMTGAGFYVAGSVASLLLGLLFFVGHLFGFKPTNTYLLVVKFRGNCEAEIKAIVKTLKKSNLKTSTMINGVGEYTFEVSASGKDLNIVERMTAVNGVINASLISYQSDFGA